MCQNLCVKGTFSRNFRCSVKDAVILLPGSNFFYFNWLQLIQRASAKVTFSWNFRCSTKKAVSLLRAWSTLDIAISKCKVPSFYFSYFHLSFLTESAYVKVIYSWNLRCSVKEAVLLLLPWSTLYVTILKCIVSWF